MRTYENAQELKKEIGAAFRKYIAEFDDIPEALKDKRIDEVERTPAENLAYQVGWTTLLLQWEDRERKGLPVRTPSSSSGTSSESCTSGSPTPTPTFHCGS